MRTYKIEPIKRYSLIQYSTWKHDDFEETMKMEDTYLTGELYITPRNAKEEEKLLNWPQDEDFCVENTYGDGNWDWEPIEFFDPDRRSDYQGDDMSDEYLDEFEDECNKEELGWSSVFSAEETWISGGFTITAPEGWEIV